MHRAADGLLLTGRPPFERLVHGCANALLALRAGACIRSSQQAERVTGLSMLGKLPHLLPAEREHKRSFGAGMIDEEPRPRYAESLQAVRRNILLARPGNPPRALLVTSAQPGEGKSTTSLNLATAFAGTNARVLLVECDLRRGNLAVRAGVTASRGLSDVLTGDLTLEDAVQQVPGCPTLSLLAAGPRPSDPAGLIASRAMTALIDRCKLEYDYVVLDATPSLGLTDAIVAARLADSVVLVVRDRFSTRKAVRRTVTALRQAGLPLIGFTLNDVSPRAEKDAYGDGTARQVPSFAQL